MLDDKITAAKQDKQSLGKQILFKLKMDILGPQTEPT